MGKSILEDCKMFTKQQKVFALDEEHGITGIIDTEIDKIPETVMSLSRDIECNVVNIKGLKAYTKGIEKNIKEYELSKYNENKLVINLIK
jgi:hypothetical protein